MISQLILVLLLLCYVNLSKNSFLTLTSVVVSRKRMQRYGLFQYKPNFSRKNFHSLTFVYKTKGVKSTVILITPYYIIYTYSLISWKHLIARKRRHLIARSSWQLNTRSSWQLNARSSWQLIARSSWQHNWVVQKSLNKLLL